MGNPTFGATSSSTCICRCGAYASSSASRRPSNFSSIVLHCYHKQQGRSVRDAGRRWSRTNSRRYGDHNCFRCLFTFERVQSSSGASWSSYPTDSKRWSYPNSPLRLRPTRLCLGIECRHRLSEAYQWCDARVFLATPLAPASETEAIAHVGVCQRHPLQRPAVLY